MLYRYNLAGSGYIPVEHIGAMMVRAFVVHEGFALGVRSIRGFLARSVQLDNSRENKLRGYHQFRLLIPTSDCLSFPVHVPKAGPESGRPPRWLSRPAVKLQPEAHLCHPKPHRRKRFPLNNCQSATNCSSRKPYIVSVLQ